MRLFLCTPACATWRSCHGTMRYPSFCMRRLNSCRFGFCVYHTSALPDAWLTCTFSMPGTLFHARSTNTSQLAQCVPWILSFNLCRWLIQKWLLCFQCGFDECFYILDWLCARERIFFPI